MKIQHAIITLIILMFFSTSAQAYNVGLVRFTAVPNQHTVELTWETATELDSAGFRLYRAAEDGAFFLLNEENLIPAVGTPTVGGSYQFVDETAVANTAYTYKLVELQLDGVEVELEQASAFIAPTATPIQMSVPTAVPTLVPATAVFTATPIPATNTSTAVPPTATIQPTATLMLPTATALQATETPAQAVAAVNTTASDQPQAPALQTTADAPYPAPNTATPLPEGYVSPPTITPFVPTQTPEGTPYIPPPTVDRNANNSAAEDVNPNITIIGEDDDSISAIEDNEPQPTPLNDTAGRLYLWAGFVIALLIFITAVFASSLIFTRKAQG